MKSKSILPTRLFGYKKKAVNEYLLETNEKNISLLSEKDGKIDDLIQQNHALSHRVEFLEEENKSLKAELREYYENKSIISKAILNAEKQAEEILKDAEAKKAEVEQDTEKATEALKTIYENKAKETGRRPAVRLKHPKA
ncbi:MAG: hypothetical protein IKJ06_02515 [Clostridia bacterium]|nr:hypothetical protein [Clostridia bacterium]